MPRRPNVARQFIARLFTWSERNRRFSSEVRDQRFHLKLNFGRQSPRTLPMEHVFTRSSSCIAAEQGEPADEWNSWASKDGRFPATNRSGDAAPVLSHFVAACFFRSLASNRIRLRAAA
jgi:hypothetical protein